MSHPLPPIAIPQPRQPRKRGHAGMIVGIVAGSVAWASLMATCGYLLAHA